MSSKRRSAEGGTTRRQRRAASAVDVAKGALVSPDRFPIFLSVAPGLESSLCAEVREAGFAGTEAIVGGVTILGNWRDVWRANLVIRGASHVLARLDAFHVEHLAALDRRARQLAWGEVLRADVPVRVEATCRKSRIYHSGAAIERVERAISEELGAPVTKEASVVVKLRLENDVCTVAVDTTGEPLHRRGHKAALNKAPMRETLASLFLRQCGYRGTEAVLDPMCGSGTFVIEAAEIASGLDPGRSRSFAFEELATFDDGLWQEMKSAKPRSMPAIHIFGSDRDAGAVRISRANAERAGVADVTTITEARVEDLSPPAATAPGLVIVNPPYGARLGERDRLKHLYRALGRSLRERFTGWRVGLLTTEEALARATGLPFRPPAAPVLHGGLRIRLYQTGPLGG